MLLYVIICNGYFIFHKRRLSKRCNKFCAWRYRDQRIGNKLYYRLRKLKWTIKLSNTAPDQSLILYTNYFAEKFWKFLCSVYSPTEKINIQIKFAQKIFKTANGSWKNVYSAILNGELTKHWTICLSGSRVMPRADYVCLRAKRCFATN